MTGNTRHLKSLRGNRQNRSNTKRGVRMKKSAKTSATMTLKNNDYKAYQEFCDKELDKIQRYRKHLGKERKG